jgi:DNA processing protein
MNPAAHLRHLYFQTKGFHPTKSESWACSRPTKLRTSMKSWSNWRQKCRPSEIFAALFELELAGKVRQMPGKNFVKRF